MMGVAIPGPDYEMLAKVLYEIVLRLLARLRRRPLLVSVWVDDLPGSTVSTDRDLTGFANEDRGADYPAGPWISRSSPRSRSRTCADDLLALP